VTPPGLRRLAAAAELCLERDQLALRRIDDAAAVLRAEAAALRQVEASPGELIGMRGELARFGVAWETLRDRRLVEIGERLAELAAQREEARVDLARACGRMSAIRKLTGTVRP
jgi:hypothetical protein